MSEAKKRYFAENPEARLLISRATKAAMARPEVQARTSEAQKKRFSDPEALAKLLLQGPRGPMAEATKRKISLANTGRPKSRESVLKNIEARKGFRHSHESRVKISMANRSRPPCSKETRAKLSAAATIQWARARGEVSHGTH